MRFDPVRRLPGFLLAAFALAVLFQPSAVSAQSCWSYVNTTAPVPITCVEQGDLSTPCSWDGDCHDDGDLSDCCTTIPATPGSQTVRSMHSIWHDCFGAVGDPDGDNPPQRGNRWYAFHRQIEADYNLWRQSFPCNPSMGQYLGCKIESVDWCPSMPLRFGYTCGASPAGGCGSANPVTDGSAQDCNPAAGLTTPCRPANATCSSCIAFARCLFRGGAGPAACPTAPSGSCSAGPISLPYTELEDFGTVEEVTTLLDLSFHGAMHGAVGATGPCRDVLFSNCSVRDPMFWRLHKAIDDVVREWQNVNAADVMLVIDRSGSMNSLDSSGAPKLDVALEAADLFADLMEGAAPPGQTNRIGIVSYASNAADAGRNLVPPVDVDSTLRDPGEPFPNTLAAIDAGGGGGCTAIGAGVEAALGAICPGGDCGAVPVPPPAGTNRRKGLLLLTDGVENIPPCLQSAGASGPGCGSQCYGAEIDYTDLYDAQVCAVGFGTALNDGLLELFAERQGGIYMQSPAAGPDGTWIDLKDFYTKCFAQLTDEFLGLDPDGVLAVGEPASEPVEYPVCGERKLTFVAGWKEEIPIGDLRLVVTSPAGDVVLASVPGVHSSTEPTWDYDRVYLPYLGSADGVWRAQLVRSHHAIVNGFTSDAFERFEDGVKLIRREIHRLCPVGCDRVLYFEDDPGSDSVYADALALDQEAGLLGEIEEAADALDLARLLEEEWDLLVYSHQGRDGAETYDSILASRLCGGLGAILTDTRPSASASILGCAGAEADGTTNHVEIDPDPELYDAPLALTDPGRAVFSYGLRAAGSAVEARFGTQSGAAVLARVEAGIEHHWFVDVLVRGLSRLEPHLPVSRIKTGDDLLPTVRIAPMSVANGGYDSVNARVEIQRPLVGVGTLIARAGLRDPYTIDGEQIDARAATLEALGEGAGPKIPTAVEVYPLFDDGSRGDQVAGNAYWSAQLPGVALADGMYRYRFILDLERDGCTAHRELMQSVFVDVGVNPTESAVRIEPGADGGYTVTLTPRDALGNLWGPGRPGTLSCGPSPSCSCDPAAVQDLGQGSYALTLAAAPGARTCTIEAFGTQFEVPLGEPRADSCDRLQEAIAGVRLGELMQYRLRTAAERACSGLTAGRGELALARTGASGALADIRHELASHAAELPDADREALETALEGLEREHGLARYDAEDDGHTHTLTRPPSR